MDKDKSKLIVLEDRVPKLKEQRKHKANRRLIFYLSLFFILILFIVYSQSSLSNISKIEVIGNEYVGSKDVIKASNLTNKTSYWEVDKDKVSEMVEKHPEIQTATIIKSFPNKVTIKVKEYERTAYVFSNGTYFPVNENGKVLKAIKSSEMISSAPLLVEWNDPEAIQEMVQELAKTPVSLASSISEIYYTPTKAEPLQVEVFMNDGREVSAKIKNFSEKIVYYPAIVKELTPEQQGVIDLEGNSFTPYKKNEQKSDE
ncbi:cell division protein FtsQ [Priestia aryabhattai]|uniref:cell division protein FtsQ/DivIB n=1 Tax=Bacillaceae TaxID=186817 RepID=UPI000BA01F92|nr:MULTISPECIES: cell division protein FtsQ/DivIB [Bacillaceae]MDT2045706.1 cell division protein FtsQ/DivIB [Priestia flexa]OZT13256.1 cell division protein FtsQ [Priestia aryabhattai]TDB50559.1 cell division protein FtsQ/DivIB [Bacillus sp. CBEL-1]USY54253.1 cell division protein FtsQ/DivIB [Bacillus sp. 1780r2a1]